MRLRLSVQRHKLPATNILWNVPSNASTQAYTIARLLEDINAILPLEAEHWGLEDYVVEIDGFECLHFSPVAQSLKDDDTVSIRPLLTAEVRARTLCGRYQINEGGQHLVDGIPFGRPHLRNPNRPSIRIPPRKRQRVLEDTVAGDEMTALPGLITANGEPSPTQATFDVVEAVFDEGQTTGEYKLGQKRKRVSFGQLPEKEVDSEEEEEEDFVPEDDSEEDAISTEAEDGSENESDDSSEDSDTSSSDSDTSSDENSTSDSDIDSASESESEPEILPSKHAGSPSKPTVGPGKGSNVTKKRNTRRTQSKHLQRLKQSGTLPPDATLQDMREGVKTQTERQEGQTADGEADTTLTTTDSKKRKRGVEETSVGDEEVDRKDGEDVTELERRKEELMKRITPEPSSSKRPSATPESTSKRLRPDVSAIGRILSRQARQVDKKTPKTKPAPAEEPQPPSDPDFWKARINLSAFECWEEDYELSAPPFPFKQHWDPASKTMHDNAKKKRQKNNEPKKTSESSTTLDGNDESLILDYGEESGPTEMAETETTAAVESQLLQDVATAAKNDLPELPEDIESLPTLEPSDIKPGTVIVFKLFELNPKTMNPEISAFKTAIVKKEGDSGNGAGEIELELAERDRFHKEKKFDKNGNRIIETADKFQMGDSDEEEDDGVLYHRFTDLMEAKLLKAA